MRRVLDLLVIPAVALMWVLVIVVAFIGVACAVGLAGLVVIGFVDFFMWIVN